jgi:hypothetical protein
VNPPDAARAALMFLSRVDFRRNERQAFDAAEAMLNAIAEGTVILAPREQARPASVDPPPVEPPAH